MHLKWTNALFWALIAALAVAGVQTVRLDAARAAGIRAALAVDSAEAVRDTSRLVRFNGEWDRALADSLRVVQRRALQVRQRSDALDRALGLERAARAQLETTVESLRATAKAAHVAVEAGDRTRSAEFDVRQEPYTVHAAVALPEPPGGGATGRGGVARHAQARRACGVRCPAASRGSAGDRERGGAGVGERQAREGGAGAGGVQRWRRGGSRREYVAGARARAAVRGECRVCGGEGGRRCGAGGPGDCGWVPGLAVVSRDQGRPVRRCLASRPFLFGALCRRNYGRFVATCLRSLAGLLQSVTPGWLDSDNAVAVAQRLLLSKSTVLMSAHCGVSSVTDITRRKPPGSRASSGRNGSSETAGRGHNRWGRGFCGPLSATPFEETAGAC